MTDRTERDRFVYDPSVRRYRDTETGGFVSTRDVNLGRHTPGRQPREERQGEPRLDELFTRRSSAAPVPEATEAEEAGAQEAPAGTREAPEDQQREVRALREALAARDRELERERVARQEADTRAQASDQEVARLHCSSFSSSLSSSSSVLQEKLSGET